VLIHMKVPLIYCIDSMFVGPLHRGSYANKLTYANYVNENSEAAGATTGTNKFDSCAGCTRISKSNFTCANATQTRLPGDSRQFHHLEW